MKVTPKRSIVPAGKRINAKRLRTDAERADAHVGGTESDVVPLTPPAAESPTPASPTRGAAPLLDPSDELTPG